MRLKTKFYLVLSVLALVPMLSVYYAQALMEQMLDAQEDGVLTTARALSTALSDRPAIFTSDVVTPFAPDMASHIEIDPLPGRPEIDGNINDWEDYTAQSVSLQYGFGNPSDRSVSARYRVGSYGKAIYLAIEVEAHSSYKRFPEQEIGEFEQNLTDDAVDQILLSTVDADGQFRQFQIKPHNSGQLSAYVLDESGALLRDEAGKVVREWDIRGEVRARTGGYDLEIKMYRSTVGPALGLGVMNVAGMLGQPKVEVIRSCESLSDPLRLGSVFAPSPEVQKVIKQLARSDSRIWVVDTQRRIIAHAANKKFTASNINNQISSTVNQSSDNLIQMFVSATAPLVRPILNLWIDSGTYEFSDPGVIWQLDEPEIDIALSGQEVAKLFREPSGEGGGVISAAHPVEVGNTVVGAVFVQETTNKVVEMRYQTLELLIAFILVILLGYVILHLLIVGNAVKRLGDLARQTENAFDKDGKVVGRIKPQVSRDEIGMLSRSLSSISIRLRNYTQYLENLSRRLSHELNTPIAVVRSSLELLSKTDSKEQGQVYMERAAGGIRRLDNLVKRMSEASALEASLTSEELEEIDLCELVTVSVEEYQCAYVHHEFKVVFAESPLRVKGSPEAFRQMLDKLIENANEFSKSDSSIDITLSLIGSDVLLQVTNQGPIIPIEHQAQIFESMVSDRKHTTQPSAQGHLGLGLYIVRLVAQFHGGKVSVRNRSDHDGVTFEVTIPHKA
ncbi:ATP-binding protein [Burkholderiales bacterium]|nr:ATP-binding protein [Burkholderiales bacterium]